MNVSLVTAPAEFVTLAQAKEHLGIETDDTANDALITALISVAREHVEDVTRRAIATQTWDYFLDSFPKEDFIRLPFGNLQSDPLATPAVAAPVITYKDTDGVSTTMPSMDYIVEKNGEGHGRIVLVYGGTWPTVTLYPSNPITIRFTCGYDSTAIPNRIKAAIKLLVADMYENRGERILGQTVMENKTVDRLLAPLRLWGEFA